MLIRWKSNRGDTHGPKTKSTGDLQVESVKPFPSLFSYPSFRFHAGAGVGVGVSVSVSVSVRVRFRVRVRVMIGF